jgi:hypothetical protein
MSHDEYAGQNHDMKKANASPENVTKFSYLRMTAINQNPFMKK